MTFFYDLNKKLSGIADKQQAKQINESAVAEVGYSAKAARAGKDIGKPGKAFAQIAKSAGERYGSKERGEKVAGAVLNKLRHPKEDVEEGLVDSVKQGAQAALQAIGNTLGHGSDEDMIKDLQKKAGVPVTGKVPPQQPGQQPGQQPMSEEGGMPMTAKQKSFAALAEPKDKITFADKIAGAKKEVDEMLGDVAAEAMKNALRGTQTVADEGNAFTGALAKTPKGGKFKVGGKEFTDTSDIDEGWDDMLKDVEKRRGAMKTGEKVKGHKGEIEKTATGIRHTRSYDEKTGETDSDDDKATGEKRGRGRPKKDKAPERVTGKAYKHKGGRKVKEDGSYGQAQQIYNDLADIRAIAKQAQGGGQFPQGFASRLEATLWAAMTLLKNQQPANAQVREQELNELSPETVASYQKKAMPQAMDASNPKAGQRTAGVARTIGRPTAEGEEELDEKAVSKAQQKFMGMAHAMQKGEKIPGASKELKKVAKTMKKGDVKDFAATKHKGLPEKKKKEVEETTVAGSVAPAEGGKAKKGSIIGKGIYDSLNRDLEAMISESMNVSVNMTMDEHGEPHKNITVSAEGEAAEQLAQLLNLAGMSAQDAGDEDCGCGTTPCSCNEEMVDENAPDWPTEPETTGGDDPHLNRWAGGLNKPKETGQTTIPVVNRDPARGSVGPMAMAEDKDLGMRLYAELKSFKA